MTIEELKQTLDTQATELKEVKTQNEQLKADIAKKDESIKNLDDSVKEQAKSIENLKVEVKLGKNVDFKSAFKEGFYSVKEEMIKKMQAGEKTIDLSFEVKQIDPIGTATNITPNNFLGVAVDPAIHAAPAPANAFIATFGFRPRQGNKLGWIEASSQSGAAYVAELAQNNALSDVDFVEKTRRFAKIATKMKISTEMEDWFDNLYEYCITEGVRLINAKIDAELYSGDGHDTNHPTDVYGLVGQSTAFSALAASSIIEANVADVIADAAGQIAKEGFNADVAFVTWAIYRQLKSLKDVNGNYLFTAGVLNGIRVLPSVRLSAGEILVADSTCVAVYAGNSYELELIRDGAYDAYDVYFRKAVQAVVPTPKQKGLIYVSCVSTAIAALKASGSAAESLAKLAGTVNDNDQIETHPNTSGDDSGSGSGSGSGGESGGGSNVS